MSLNSKILNTYKQFGFFYFVKGFFKRLIAPIVKMTSFYIVTVENHIPEKYKGEIIIVDVNNLENVTLVNMGVFSKKDELTLYEQGIWPASSSAFITSEKQIKIKCDTLDKIIQKLENNQKLVIKMDIEGSEYDALLGGIKTPDSS